MFESKAGVFLIGGLLFFAFAFVSNAVVPIAMYSHLPEEPVLDYATPDVQVEDNGDWLVAIEKPDGIADQEPSGIEADTNGNWFVLVDPIEDTDPPSQATTSADGKWKVPVARPTGIDGDPDGIVTDDDTWRVKIAQPEHAVKGEDGTWTVAHGLVPGNDNIMWQFQDLAKRYPEQFEEAFGTADQESCAEALRLGRQVYVGEGCWHCHSQFVRPVSNESKRWGPVSETWEYQNELQRPVLFGTRRVGPDLSRQGGRHSNGWHAVHFWDPPMVSPESPMPPYPWLFDGDPSKPNRRGLALMTYVQWLGSWHETYPYYEEIEEVRGSE